MRKLSVIFVLLLVAATFASAELLTTANPIGQGKWVVLGGYLSDSDYAKPVMAGLSAATIAGYAGYGVMDKLDVYAVVGSMTVSGLPAGFSMSAVGYGLNAKYEVLDEASAPVSVAVGAGYKMLTTKATGIADGSGNQMMVGVGVSKIMAPFVPYGAVTYRTTTLGIVGGIGDGTQIDATVGTAIAWSTQGAVFAEYTLQSMTPKAAGATAYSSGQLAIGVGYKI